MAKLSKALQAASGFVSESPLSVDDVFKTYIYNGTSDENVIENGLQLGDVGYGSYGVFGGENGYYTPILNPSALRTTSTLTGATNGKTFTFSAWVRNIGGFPLHIFDNKPSNGSTGIDITITTAGLLVFDFIGTDNLVKFNASYQLANQAQWTHVLFSVDLSSGAHRAYVNDVDVTATVNWNTEIDGDINFTSGTDQRIGQQYNGTMSKGGLSNVFLSFVYTNLSVEANRRKFITATGEPASSDTTASLNPILYMPLSSSYAVTKNLGTAQDFTSTSGSYSLPTIQTTGGPYKGTGYGGLVWTKFRDGSIVEYKHTLANTVSGPGYFLELGNNTTNGNSFNSETITSFNGDGYTLGRDGNATGFNYKTGTTPFEYVSWAWRQAPKFFEIVQYTGDGNASQEIAHTLGSTPGCIIVKQTNNTGDWAVFHKDMNGTNDGNAFATLNGSAAASGFGRLRWGDTVAYISPTSTAFTVADDGQPNSINKLNSNYIAYIFAHNDGDGNFGPDENQDIIKCGNYTGNGAATGLTVDLGFEPQWIMIRNVSDVHDWYIFDIMRSMSVTTAGDAQNVNDRILRPNQNQEETGLSPSIGPLPNGFRISTNNQNFNAANENHIYIAIRRGGMTAPTSPSEVFNTLLFTGTGSDTFLDQQILCDAVFTLCRSNNQSKVTGNRLINGRTGGSYGLKTNTDVNTTITSFGYLWWDYNRGWEVEGSRSETNTTNETYVNYAFKRSRSFFDVSSHVGDGTNLLTVPHNLGVVPEMMMTKMYSLDTGAGSPSIRYFAYHKDLAVDEALWFDSDAAVITNQGYWADTRPTAENFYVGGPTSSNINLCKYVTYLFASIPGVSKVGSFSHTLGSTTDVDCGFSSGSQFVIVKRYDFSGYDWWVWDSQRGIGAGNDPILTFNTTQTEQTNADYIDTLSSGFQMTTTLPTGDYIFYAIAAP